MKSNFFSILKKVDGELIHTIKAKGTLYKNWIKELPEGTKIEIFASVYGEDGTNAQLAKIHAMIEDVIESSHNGIVSWEKESIVNPVMIQGSDDHIKTKERWKILEEFFSQKDIDYMKIDSVKGGILSKIVNLNYLLDYSSIYTAILNEIDPTPVRSIDYIKSKL